MRKSDFREKRRMTSDDVERDRETETTKGNSIRMQVVIDACRKKTCELCGRPCAGEPHHIKTRGAGGSDVPENLIQLCGRCHRAAHDGKIPKEQLQRIVARKLGITEAELQGRLAAIEGKGGSFDTAELRIIEEEARRDSRRKAVPLS